MVARVEKAAGKLALDDNIGLESSLYDRVEVTNPNRSVLVKTYWGGEKVGVGDTISMSAVLEGYEGLEVSIRWQYDTGDGQWYDTGSGNNYSFILSADNYFYSWRAVVDVLNIAE